MRKSAPLAVAGRYATGFLLILAWGCQSLAYAQPEDFSGMLLTGGTVLLGAAALGWLRPPRVGLTAPQAMLLLGAFGMLLGLMIDSRATELEALASLCALGDRNLWSMLRLHWTLLPWMHAGMWAGGLAAIPLLRTTRPNCRRQYCARLVQNVACSAWMTVGMAAGVLLTGFLASQSGARSPAAMLGSMFGGMVWGMVTSVALYRLYFNTLPWVTLTFSRRGAGTP